MAALSLVRALNALAQLDRELGEVVRDLKTGSADPAIFEVFRAGFARLEAQRLQVRESVVASAAADDLAWRESMLRARTVVVLAQLAHLEDVARDVPPADRPLACFASVRALHACIVSRITRIVGGVRRECNEADRGTLSPLIRTALHRVAYGKGEYGFAALGVEPVGSALLAGSRARSKRFALACETLNLALGLCANRSTDLVPELPPLPPRVCSNRGGLEHR